MTAHKYYKRGLVTAEQFDGSAEVADRYDIALTPASMTLTPGEGTIETLEGPLTIRVGDWIATGVNGEHWPIADEIFHATYAPLPVIPQKVADYIRKAKAKEDER